LRYRVGLRAALRVAKEPRVEAILHELTIDAKKRLELIDEANGNFLSPTANHEPRRGAECAYGGDTLRFHGGHLLEMAQCPRLPFQGGEKAVGPVLDIVA
jgi:hypothetical protein